MFEAAALVLRMLTGKAPSAAGSAAAHEYQMIST
jgi:hypothetical protein